jgi:hypothetical protein
VAHSDLIDSLIATYRTLNLTVRPIASNRASQAGADGRSLLDILGALRERELVTSQQLKNMTMADVRTSEQVDNVNLPEPFDPNDPRVLLSEFGTAREAILALVRNMPDEQLDMERPGVTGTTTIRAVIEDLVRQDEQILNEIQALVPAGTA